MAWRTMWVSSSRRVPKRARPAMRRVRRIISGRMSMGVFKFVLVQSFMTMWVESTGFRVV